jgi:predicted enzyme related to lactoylglutathione lyase
VTTHESITGEEMMAEKVNPVGWFEIPVEDMARAKKFYESVFEVTLEEHQMGPDEMAWFPMDTTSIGAGGTLIKGDGYTASPNGVLVYFTAPDLDATVERAKAGGGTIVIERMDIGEHGVVAMVIDTEGNRIGLHTRQK